MRDRPSPLSSGARRRQSGEMSRRLPSSGGSPRRQTHFQRG